VRTEFVVVGAGICGLAAAWALTRRGHEVMVLDQAPVGHADGGSYGACRVFRLGYDNPAYVTLAIAAREVWTELEEACGERLLHPTPQLTFGPQLEQVRAAIAQAGAPGELLSEAEASERFPGIAVAGQVLLEPGSAVISADRTLAALARLTGLTGLTGPAAGGELVRVTGLAEHSRGVTLATTAGHIDADRVIVCAGPWTAGLVAGAGIRVPGSASMAQVGYLVPARPGSAGAGTMPIFVHYGGEFYYGLPEPGSDRYKIGIHLGGPPVDPDHQDHSADAALSQSIDRAVRQFLPSFDPSHVTVERCIYDNSPDTDFIIDRIGNVVIGCGTSGHGFKFGPLIGEWLAYLATDRPRRSASQAAGSAPPPFFALSRF
jgi:sarcosine oxidase